MNYCQVTNHEGRMSQYKSKGLNTDSLRQKKRDDEVQIRKQKRESLLENRRKIVNVDVKSLGLVNDEIMADLMSEEYSRELLGVRKIHQGVCSNLVIDEVANRGLLSLLSDICINRPELVSAIHEIFLILSKDKERGKDSSCYLIHLCSIIEQNSRNVKVLTDAIQAVSLFVGLNVAFRNVALDKMIVPLLLNAYTNNDLPLRRRVMWLVSQLFHKLNNFSPEIEEVEPLLDLVLAGLADEDPVIQCDAMRAVALMAEWEDFHPKIIEHDLLPIMLARARGKTGIVNANLLRVIIFIHQCSYDFTTVLINNHLFDTLKVMLREKNLTIDVYKILRDVTDDGNSNIQELLNVGILENVSVSLETATFQTRKAAAYVVCNFCKSTNQSHLQAVIDSGFLKSCTDLLTTMDTLLVISILDALQNLLKYGDSRFSHNNSNPVAFALECLGAKAKLEFLTESQDMTIHVKSYGILDRFFTDEELVEYNSCAAEMQGQRNEVDATIDKVLSEICSKQS